MLNHEKRGGRGEAVMRDPLTNFCSVTLHSLATLLGFRFGACEIFDLLVLKCFPVQTREGAGALTRVLSLGSASSLPVHGYKRRLLANRMIS